MAEQSLRLGGRKVCNIKRVGISQAESNKATVCALPSIHLPLTREARVIVLGKGTAKKQSVHMASVMVRSKGLSSFCNDCGDGRLLCMVSL